MNIATNGIMLITIAILEIVLGLYFLLRYQHQKKTTYYALFIIGVAIWVFSNGIFYVNASDFWGRMAFIGATLLAAFFLIFSRVFPYEDKRFGAVKGWLLLILVIFFTVTLFATQLFIVEFDDPLSKNVKNIHGPVYYLFAAYILVCFVLGIKILINKYKKSDGIHRWQLRYLLIGVILSSAFGLTFNLVFPLFGDSSYSTYGPASSIIWLGFTSYIILKK